MGFGGWSECTHKSGAFEVGPSGRTLASMIRCVHDFFPESRLLHGSIVVYKQQPSGTTASFCNATSSACVFPADARG
jgi:hypothetical protein